jgi:HB1, ASXL, restriction endonuclease HTH domain
MAKKSKATLAHKFPATAKALSQDLAAPAKTTSEPVKAGKATKSAKKKMSALDAAAKVLGETGTAMTTNELIDVMAKKRYWSSPNGETPAATLYSAILREVNTKGKESRFAKTERGKFALKA